jgi:PBP1b-binding outer membrane lipoprotein LpoB
MKRYIVFPALVVSVLLSGCAGMSGAYTFTDIDSLVEEASWSSTEVLWNAYEDIESAPMRTLAVYYFLENGAVSPLSDALIEGMSIAIANAVNYEGIQVRVVSRTNLDQILQELAFQTSDLVDQTTQISVGRQLGAEIIVTGTISSTEEGKKLNIQLLEIETGTILGGFIMYLLDQ